MLSGHDTVCPGGEVKLQAVIAGGVTGGEVFTWFRNGVQLESTGDILVDYPQAVDNDVTNYIYEVIVSQNAAGCQSVITPASTHNILVVPNPTIELAGDPIVCDETVNNVVVNANVVYSTAIEGFGYTYQWFENNVAIEGANTTTLTLTKEYRDYPYSFTFAVMNQFGCTVESEPFNVYVNDVPIVNITVDDNNICANGTVTLTADLYDQNADNMVYQWYTVNGTTETAITGAYNMTYTTSLATTTKFKFKAFQRDSHCEAYSNELTVNVVPAPEITSISVVSTDLAICEGHIVSLKANAEGGVAGEAYTYTWYKDDAVVEGVTGDTYTDYPMAADNDITTHVYNVTVAQASSECASVIDVNDAITVTVRPNPRYTIYGDADVCESASDNIMLTAVSTDSVINQGSDFTFTWYESGVEIAGASTPILSINKPAQTEPYIFKLVVTDNAYGCSTETEEFHVYVSARPVVTITSTENDICTNGVVTLTANIYDQNADNLAYQWQNSPQKPLFLQS